MPDGNTPWFSASDYCEEENFLYCVECEEDHGVYDPMGCRKCMKEGDLVKCPQCDQEFCVPGYL